MGKQQLAFVKKCTSLLPYLWVDGLPCAAQDNINNATCNRKDKGERFVSANVRVEGHQTAGSAEAEFLMPTCITRTLMADICPLIGKKGGIWNV